MPATYEPIATTTLGSAQSSIAFSSIPGTYTDLVLVSNFTGSGGDFNALLTFNSDTGSNYSETVIYGNGSSAASGRQTSATSIRSGYNNAERTINRINIMNYSNSTTNKTVLIRWDSGGYTDLRVGLWRSTNAITSLSLTTNQNNFASGSTFTLYGIKAA